MESRNAETTDNVQGKFVKDNQIVIDANERPIVDDFEAEDGSQKSEQLYSEDAAKATEYMPEEVKYFNCKLL